MNKSQRLGQQIIMIRHLHPLRVFSLLLFRLAAKIEIRMQPPVLDWPNLIEEGGRDAAGYFGERVLFGCGIPKNDAEKNRGIATPIFAQTIRYMDSLRTEFRNRALDRIVQ